MTTTATGRKTKRTQVRRPTEADREADRVIEAAKDALAVGNIWRARELVAQGLQRTPNHTHLRKLAAIIAPPVVTVVPTDPETTRLRRIAADANRRWFREHTDEYRGQWVAIENGVLLASGASVAQIQEHLPPGVKPLITMVF